MNYDLVPEQNRRVKIPDPFFQIASIFRQILLKC